MRLSEFDYDLPPERIAQQPLAQRDASRLLRLDRATGALEDRMFRELPDLLRPSDLLVANDSRVFPARLHGQLESTSPPAPVPAPPPAPVEVLLLRQVGPAEWEALVRPGRKLGPGARIRFAPELAAEVVAVAPRGQRHLRFAFSGDWDELLARLGHVPLPPYIRRPDISQDRERYQTVYADPAGPGGSAAAPTAGLHFTPELLARLGRRGISWTTVRLDVGLGTFQPVTVEEIEDHPMHTERYAVSPTASAAIRAARAEGRRLVAVGTTAARVLESIAPGFAPGAGETGIFLYPGRSFQAVDALITNFHAPRTTLLMMIAAFASPGHVRRAYAHALASGYRFLSFGDAMLIA